jgi:hypothetical protein
MSTVVTSGLYRFFSKAQLDVERLRYVAEVQKANTQLTSASVNGQSFQFSVQGRELSLSEWGDELAAAYCSIGITTYGTPGSSRASIGSSARLGW